MHLVEESEDASINKVFGVSILLQYLFQSRDFIVKTRERRVYHVGAMKQRGDESPFVLHRYERRVVREYTGKRVFSMDRGRKTISISKYFDVKKRQDVVHFQFESEVDVRMFRRKVGGKQLNVFWRTNQNKDIIHISCIEDWCIR